MSGKPAARQTDMTKHGGPIVQGSLTVLIGSQGGIACSSCPGGKTAGSPVNPVLGAKVLPAETDLLLPGSLAFALTRSYSSYQTDTPAPVGLLGPGWWLPLEASLIQSDKELILNDTGGRSIHFEPLAPGEMSYSRSENLWIVRGGLERLDDNPVLPISRLALAWQGIKAEYRTNAAFFFAANSLLGPWWVFSSGLGHESGSAIEGMRLPQQGLIDRFGCMQRCERALEGQPHPGALAGVHDGAGRHYRFELTVLPKAINEGEQGWGADSGLRLAAVHLQSDPLSLEEPPAEPLARYGYTPKGELASVHVRGKQLRGFEYHPQLLGRMSAHSHAGRPPSSYVYNDEGKVISQSNPGALSYQFDYEPNKATITDSLGRKEVLHLKGEGGLRRIVKTEHPDGSSTESQFDMSGRQTASTDALGRKTDYEIDVSNGRLQGITRPDGKQHRIQYDEHGSITRIKTPDGEQENRTYDELGRLTSQTNALGQSTHYRYPDNKTDLPHEIEDARGGIKQLEWNSAGQLTRYSDCSGGRSEYRYDRWGQLIEVRGEEGQSETREYDMQGRLTAQTDAQGQTVRYEYNSAGDLIAGLAPDGQPARFERDEWGRLAAFHQGGLSQHYEHDEAGRLITLINENTAKTTFQYDAMDRLIEQINFDSRTQRYRYDAAGQLLESEDAGQITGYQHDRGGRLTARATNAGKSEGHLDNYHYDASGRLIRALSANGDKRHVAQVEFTRDQLGRITGETQTLSEEEGQAPIWEHQIKHSYDELGNEEQTMQHGLPALNWQTYGSGHLHGITLGQRSLIDFERDKLYRETQRHFAGTSVLKQYDSLSRLLGIRAHDQALRPLINRNYHYDAIGQITGIDTLQGEHRYGYDKARRLIEAEQLGQKQQNYWFDPAGNRLFNDPRETIGTEQEKERWAELVKQNVDNPQFNLLDSHMQGQDNIPFCWMDNRILDDGKHYYKYDRYGNLIEKYNRDKTERHRYGYDTNQRLIRYAHETPGKTTTAHYFYDPFGRRVARQTQEVDKESKPGELKTSFYGWDGDRLVLTEEGDRHIHTIYEPNTFIPLIRIEGKKQPAMQTLGQKFERHTQIKLTEDNQRLFDRIERQLRADQLDPAIAQYLVKTGSTPQMLRDMLDDEPGMQGKSIHFYHCDHLGTPMALINQQGEIDWQIELDPWGNTIKEHNPKNIHQPIRFQGQHWDEESGLHYNRYRYYDPMLGRYATQDPIGLKGGVNLSLYSINPPLQIDPLGLQAAAASAPASAASAPQYCTYSQSSGQFTCTKNGQQTINAIGYAGTGPGRNNPDMQQVHDVGPLPRGDYTIGPAYYNQHTGPITHNLTPDPATEMYTRDLMRIHGNNSQNDASNGCIILPPAVRSQLHGGDRLKVTQ
jgi:RHS repeat-associated protein